MLIAILSVSITVRLAPLVRSDLSFAYYPDDSFEYLQLADGMRSGCGFARLINGSCQTPEILRTPGYPILLAAIGHNLRSVLAVQAVIGALVGLMVALWLAYQWNFIAGVAAQLIIACDVPSIVMANQIMAEALFQAIIAVAVFIPLLASGRPRRAVALGVLAGLLAGLAELTRPIAIVLPILMPVPFLADRKIQLRQRFCAAGMAFAIPLIIGAGWATRNYKVAQYPGLSTISAINMYYYRAADVVARQQGTMLAATRDSFGSRLGVPFEHIFDANVQSPELFNRMNRLAFGILAAHPIEALVMTIQSAVYIAVTPMRSPVARMMGTAGATAGEGLNSGAPSVSRIRATLRMILESPLLTATVLFEALLAFILWIGLGFAIIRCVRADSNYRLWILYLFVTGLFLMMLAAGGEANVRFRSPTIPLLAAAAALGYFPGRQSSTSEGIQDSSRARSAA
ncbi:MAG: hypothetical protein JO166_20855 [Deltaproteobacteria bacterium]|nr:hypothetical protein [Deltaproteobacteria bacterium]